MERHPCTEVRRLYVAEADIDAAIAAGAGTLDALQTKLAAGTKCGGCVPELRRRLAERSPVAA